LSIVPLVWLLFGVGVGIAGFIGLVRGRLAQYLEVLAAAYLVIAVAMTSVVVRSAQAPRGHARLFIVVDDLNVPGDSVEVAQVETGPDFAFAGDYPRVSKYYVSQHDAEDTCGRVRAWAMSHGLSEDSVPSDGFLTCGFRGVVDSNQVSVLVSPAREAGSGTIAPIPIEMEHEAVVEVYTYSGY
jgi:hypothetical protein